MLEESSLVSFKNIEEAQYEIEVLKNRMNSFPVEIQESILNMERRISNADGIIIIMELKKIPKAS